MSASQPSLTQKENDMKDPELVIPSNISVPVEHGSMAEAAELGRQIKASEQKAVAHVLETAHLCELGFQKYRTRGLPVLLRAAEMSKTTFMKYVGIAHDTRLKRIENLLPPNFTTIHQICQLTDEEFEEAIRAEIIRPTVRRREIEYLRETTARDDKEPAHALKPPPALMGLAAGGHYELVAPNDLGPDDRARIGKLLQRLHAKFGVEIVAINTEPHE
jgi:hypothetical protein